MLTQIIFIGLVAPATGYFIWKRSQTPNKPASRHKKTSNSKKITKKTTKLAQASPGYKCVEIKAGLMACKAVGAYKSKRLLLSESPTLPVPGCNSKECVCKFIRYDDRRKGDRRSQGATAASHILLDQNNKRIRTDRRKTSPAS